MCNLATDMRGVTDYYPHSTSAVDAKTGGSAISYAMSSTKNITVKNNPDTTYENRSLKYLQTNFLSLVTVFENHPKRLILAK